jgi:predicted alpha/beta-fold hydrolase
LTGLLSEIAGSETLLLIVHGLAGNALSPYCARAAAAAAQSGYSSLRLSMRGADYSGEDIFHGGTIEDLRAALAAPEIAWYKRVLLLGYSVGGHIALRAAIDSVDSRLRAAAAVCPPLDLHAATAAFDRPERSLYRRHIFRHLNKAYAAAAARGRAPVSTAIVERSRSCRERDSLTVVPRFGFRSAADYYDRESVAPKLSRLQIPSLVLVSRHDPMVPAETLGPVLGGPSPALSVVWAEEGGHVYFPPTLNLGQPGALGVEPQVIAWLAQH